MYSHADFHTQTFSKGLDEGLVKHLQSQCYVKIAFHHHRWGNKELIRLWLGRRAQRRLDRTSEPSEGVPKRSESSGIKRGEEGVERQ